MTREEEINIAMKESVTETIYSSGYGFTRQATDLLECAWVKGAEWADETMIEKACLYLKEALINTRDNFGYAVVASFDTIDLDGFIEEFRKEMKGE